MWGWRRRAESASSSPSIGSTFPCSRGSPAPCTTSSPIWRRAEPCECASKMIPSYDLLTIGPSTLAADRSVALLKSERVSAIADVRSVPFSRWCPWFSSKALAQRLAEEGIVYIPLGDALGGRPRDPSLYRDGVADYEAMAARPEFAAGLAQVVDESARHRVCLLCAERDPLDCHRCLLIGPALAQRGLAVGHILADGTIEPHSASDARFRAMTGGERFPGPSQRPAQGLCRPRQAVGAR